MSDRITVFQFDHVPYPDLKESIASWIESNLEVADLSVTDAEDRFYITVTHTGRHTPNEFDAELAGEIMEGQFQVTTWVAADATNRGP